MDVEATTEVVIQAYSTYTTPQWDDFRAASSREEALDYVERAPELMLRVVERTVVTIKGEWSEVTR